MSDNTIKPAKKESCVALIIYKRSLGGYEIRWHWQIFVNGHHFMTSNVPYYFDYKARSAGVLQLLKLDGYFTTWRLSE